MSAVVFRDVTKRFENGYAAFENLSFDVPEGRFVSMVGPSGCGKSTVLNLAAGLQTSTTGRIESFGQPLDGVNRQAAYMFQQDALLPWKTVRQNAEFGLSLQGRSTVTASDWLRRVGLEPFADSFPYQLSGGMRKRVAMAQCLAVEPKLLLMDEPFSALDVHTRLRMEQELLDLWSSLRNTVLFITHDLEEAIELSDEVVVLSAGPASRIIGRYSIDLPRPRQLLDLKTDARFIEIYRSIWHELRAEVVRSYER